MRWDDERLAPVNIENNTNENWDKYIEKLRKIHDEMG